MKNDAAEFMFLLKVNKPIKQNYVANTHTHQVLDILRLYGNISDVRNLQKIDIMSTFLKGLPPFFSSSQTAPCHYYPYLKLEQLPYRYGEEKTRWCNNCSGKL